MRNKTGAQYAAEKYLEIPVREATTIMEFLLKQMGVSRNRAKDLLSGRAVAVDRKLTTQYDTPLAPGQMVRISRHRQSTMLVSKYIRIVYEDKDLVVIEKNAGILSMAATARQFSIKNILDEYFTKRHFKCTAHVVHRLDRDTSGLMMYAKNRETSLALEENWKDTVYDRRYVAVLCGKMPQEGGTERSYLKDNKAFITYSSDTDNGGKLAITHYRRLRSNDNFTLAEMKLETGRKNQIRVHMADIGFPIAGDKKYGNAVDPLGRLCLHAYRLNFIHPVTGEDMQFETPVPKEFLKLF